MLSAVLNGSEKSPVVLIFDKSDAPGTRLLEALVCSLTARVDEVHVFLYEVLPGAFLSSLPQTSSNKIVTHDIVSDPLGWDGNTSVTMETDLCDYVAKQLVAGANKQIAIVIDSLSNLILHRSPAYTCQVLHKLGKRDLSTPGVSVCQVVAMVHSGLHDNSSLSMLRHTATSVLDLGPPVNETHHGSCQILHKKPSGKVINMRCEFRVSESFTVTETEALRPVIDTRPAGGDTAPDPAANLTFNLTLNEREKEARSKVILPYLHKAHRPEAPSEGTGKIFYQPDDADDFDEEDPDDDLDI